MQFPVLRGIALVAISLLASCSGDKGDSAPPPTDVTLKAGDGVVAVTFTATPGVDYWILYAPGTNVTTDNWVNLPGAAVVRNAVPPQIISPLKNDQIYSFTVNARISGGTGGPGSPSLSATPRLSGVIWTAGTPLGNVDLRGIASVGTFVTVGSGGALFTSTDGKTFTAGTSGVTADLNDVIGLGVVGAATFYVVGAAGTIISSTDATNWTARTSGTTANLNSIAVGLARYVAVGDNGAIVSSGDGVTFTPAASGTTANLYRVVFSGSQFIAVGAGGTILSSADGLTWSAVTSNTTADLRGLVIAYNQWNALGSNGTFLTSTDAITWTVRPNIGTANFRAVTYVTQLVAVGANGVIYTSTDGTNWTAQNSGTTATLNAVSRIPFGYVAVGAAGTNLTTE